MPLDDHGPFRMSELREIADALFQDEPEKTPLIVGLDCPTPEAADEMAAALESGRSVVVLWMHDERMGHFVALVPRAGRRQNVCRVELFDPEARGEATFRGFMESDGRNQGLAQIFAALGRRAKAGGRRLQVDHSDRRVQAEGAASCGPWCLVRIAHATLAPWKFRAMFA